MTSPRKALSDRAPETAADPHYTFPQKVLFKHCDPAGIVFYPRYFEMINDAVEAMFCDLLGMPFETLHPNAGVPTVAIDIEFKAPSRHGDQLRIQLTMTAIGRTSLTLRIVAEGEGSTRFTARQTLVHTDGEGRPASWPEDLRARVSALMGGAG